MYKYLVLVLLFLNTNVLFADVSSANEEKIHKELRKILNGLEDAVNHEKYSELSKYFHKDMTITMSNQEVLSSPEDINKFFNFWFGEGGYLKHVKMQLTADSLTKLYADNTIGVVHGKGIEDTYLSDDRFFPMQTRWSATLIKDADEKWKILSLHIGVDFLNNPVVDMLENSAKIVGLIGGVIGLILGLLYGFLFWRKKTATNQ